MVYNFKVPATTELTKRYSYTYQDDDLELTWTLYEDLATGLWYEEKYMWGPCGDARTIQPIWDYTKWVAPSWADATVTEILRKALEAACQK